MAQSSALSTLIELAEKSTDDAAVKLGNAIRASDDMEKKLGLLKKYREDYTRKLQAELKAGRDIQHIRNFQQFMGKIDDAIHSQQQLVDNAKKKIVEEQQNWQANERKRMSFTTLEERADKAEKLKQDRREQRQTDEIGSRTAIYNKTPLKH